MVNQIMEKSKFNQGRNSDEDIHIVDVQEEDSIDVVNNNEEEEFLQDELTRAVEHPLSPMPEELPPASQMLTPPILRQERFLAPPHLFCQQALQPPRVYVEEPLESAPRLQVVQPAANTAQRSTQTRLSPNYAEEPSVGEAPPSPRQTASVAQVMRPPWEPTESLRQSAESLRQSTEQLRRTLLSATDTLQPANRSAKPANRPAQAANRPAQPGGQSLAGRLRRSLLRGCNVMRREAAALRRRKIVAADGPTVGHSCCAARPKLAPVPFHPFANGGRYVKPGPPIYEDDSLFIYATRIAYPKAQFLFPSTVTNANAIEGNFAVPSLPINHGPLNQGRYVCFWCPYNSNDDKDIARHMLHEHPEWFIERPITSHH